MEGKKRKGKLKEMTRRKRTSKTQEEKKMENEENKKGRCLDLLAELCFNPLGMVGKPSFWFSSQDPPINWSVKPFSIT